VFPALGDVGDLVGLPCAVVSTAVEWVLRWSHVLHLGVLFKEPW